MRRSPVRALRVILPLLAALAPVVALGACGGGNGTTSTRAAAALPGARRPLITLGTQSVPEQVLLGQLYQQALQAKGFTVEPMFCFSATVKPFA